MTQFPDMEDKTVRHDYLTERLTLSIGEQIKAMREARGWSYADMGLKMNRGEFWVARLERPDYEKYNLALLLEIAALFDVWLNVEFVDYSAGQEKTGVPYVPALSFERERRAAAKAAAESAEPAPVAAPAVEKSAAKPITPAPFGNWPEPAKNKPAETAEPATDKPAEAKGITGRFSLDPAPVSEPWESRGMGQGKPAKKK